ncbi:unnamed protein product [Bursaphelenchus xylophilus]|uniref:non-specific serine/threonine protein kinase n=1 Tax=Bursaphelenchus xylophilus TaxID=6326 RepID=A0A1I7S4S1_BURXY|nr:unnamed protein product [Bursaphelenchus xylophilus]CAG9117334.1 unnamed protein product [Bursaphelenchus xylophilus]
MPLGFFSSNSSKDGPKPQPLTSEKEKKFKDVASSNAGVEIKESKGATIKLGKKSYVIEKKLAEGGYAIVYLVQDKHNRCYALKRQLIRDDPRQVEACKTEAQIVKNLNGHKNIVAYVDHSLGVNKAGIYDYMLLTVYYKSNVLQLLNSRLLNNKWLSTAEILDIFCDVCESVARLHHSKTPVIHRDLKVENILIDERTGGERPIYVLCDFGSATTKVMSRDTCTQYDLEEEIKKYTTPSYRAPEMIDLFAGTPIDTKSDIWALGVLLYKLCYFALPFGDSILAIQNGTFSFPDQPEVPDEIKAIINLLLTASAKHRPNIYQASYLAFSAAKRKCPVYNIEKCPRIELTEAVEIYKLRGKLGANYARRLEKALNDFEEQKIKGKVQPPKPELKERPAEKAASSPPSDKIQEREQVSIPVSAEGMIVNTEQDRQNTQTTSVNPRLRPKASTTVGGQFLPPVGTSPRMTKTPSKPPEVTYTNASLNYSYDSSRPDFSEQPGTSTPAQNSVQNPLPFSVSTKMSTAITSSYPTTSAADAMKVSQISTDSSKSAPDYTDAAYQRTFSNIEEQPFTVAELSAQPRARNAATLPATALRTSAFQPYSMSHRNKSDSEQPEPVKSSSVDKEPRVPSESLNPFVAEIKANVMDDNDFGERFDQIRRVNRRNTVDSSMDGSRISDTSDRRNVSTNLDETFSSYTKLFKNGSFQLDAVTEQRIEEDPFGAAPILSSQILAAKPV